MPKISISFYTLGCRLNQSETAVIQHSFALDDSFQIVDFNDPADIVVLNTCTVTEKGDTDTRKLINRITRQNPQSRIALIGCQAEIQKKQLTRYKNVKWIVGNAKKIDLLSIIKDQMNQDVPIIITPEIPKKHFTIPIAGLNRKKTRANIKIQDGCNFFCSFCEIPYARGRARSREFNDILKEANSLAQFGYKELIITGINVGTYRQNNHKLLDVIKSIEEIQGIERIRISSIEFTTIDKSMVNHMARSQKLCPYLHIPLQSACDKVLKSMNRKYTYEQFKDFINFAYKTVPHICLGTDLIVGYPLEDTDSFNITFENLKESHFHYFHVFSYSKRNLAKSKQFTHSIDPQTIQKRSATLRNLSKQKRKAFHDSYIGSIQPVLFEQKKRKYWTGLTDNYIRVSVQSEDNLANLIKNVKIISNDGEKVFGKIY